MYIGTGIVAMVLGAILAFALSDRTVYGIDLPLVGWILMAGGALAIVLSLYLTRRTHPRGYTSSRVSQVDPHTGARVDETRVDPDNRV